MYKMEIIFVYGFTLDYDFELITTNSFGAMLLRNGYSHANIKVKRRIAALSLPAQGNLQGEGTLQF